jgi:hypothetical protein
VGAHGAVLQCARGERTRRQGRPRGDMHGSARTGRRGKRKGRAWIQEAGRQSVRPRMFLSAPLQTRGQSPVLPLSWLLWQKPTAKVAPES